MKRLILLLTLVMAVPAVVAGHHSMAAAYRLDETRAIEGYVAQISVREPHSLMHVITANQDGSSNRWTAEWGETAAIPADDSRDIRVGDFVRVIGHPDRNGEVHRLLIVRVTAFVGPSTQ